MVREYYWVTTDKWMLKEAVHEIGDRGDKVIDIVCYQADEIEILVETRNDE